MPSPRIHNRDRIKELLAKGCTYNQICARLGINKSALVRIVAQEKKVACQL